MVARSILLTSLLVFLHGWACAQTVNLQVSAIPAAATRVVAVVDQGGLGAPLRFTKDVAAGVSTSALSLAVPAGGPYRIRAIAFTSGLAYPAILRAGKTSGVLVPNQTTVTAQIALAAFSATLDSTTPSSVPAGSTVTLAANVIDPGDTGSGATGARVYSLTSALPGNQLGDQRTGPFERITEGAYHLSAILAAPSAGSTLYYQFAYNAWDFNDANRVEQPYWFWPNINAGEVSLSLASQSSSKISVTVSALPTAATRLVAVVDGGTLQRPVRVAKSYTSSQTSSSIDIDVPAGTAYRVRVVAFTAGSVRPAILRTGKSTGVSAPSTISIPLTVPAFTLATATPSTAAAGSTVSMGATLVDAGDAAAGMTVGSVYSQPQTFTTNLGGTEWRGTLESLGSGIYRFTAPMTLPSSASTIYYQFAAHALDFDDPSGLESPYLCWPNPAASQTLKQISSTIAASIRITVSGVPSTATRLIALVDQGALTKPARAAVSFTAGAPPSNFTVGVPAGGPYRVRLIAVRSGAATPVILRSGKVASVSVASGATADATITLTDYTVALGASTPSSGTAGTLVSVVASVADPGETASGSSSSIFYGASSSFTQNFGAAPIAGLLEKNTDGTIKLTSSAPLPGAGGFYYYQLAYEALPFSDPDGVERPFFCWPNLEAGQSLKQIAVNANPSMYMISGVVTLNGSPLSGVTVTLSGTRTGSVVTGSDGAYSFQVLPAGSYTVTAARSNFIFSPATSSLTLASNQTVNIAATQIAGSINLTVSGLPSTGNRIVAVLDGGGLATPLRTVQNYTPGQSAAALSMDAPVSASYRVRVMAYAAVGANPAILRTGKATSVSAPGSITVTLTDASLTPLAGTLVSAPAAATVTLEATLADPGDTAAAVAVARIYSASQPFIANLAGAESRGTLQSISAGSYRASVPLTLPASIVTTYYQFVVNAFDFNDPAGSESPQFIWPNLQTGQALSQIATTPPSSIQLSVSGTPAAATRLIVVVDQGGLTQPVRTAASFAPGQAPASIPVYVPAGSGYHVRVIAVTAGATTPAILRSAVATGVSVSAGTAAPLTVVLADYTVTLDPATPSSGITGTAVNVIANIIDPGETGSITRGSQLYGATAAFTQNLSGTPIAGRLTKNTDGSWKLNAPVTLPAAGAIFYYQLAYEAADFASTDATERPFFCWPNLQAAQPLKQITSNPKPILYTISGAVTLNGSPIRGVTVTLSGLQTGSVVTGSDGTYAFADLSPGSYTVTAARTSFTFATPSVSLTLASNRTVNFIVTQVTGTIGVSRSVLRFGATMGAAAATANQEIVVDVSDNLPVGWSVESDQAWLKVAPSTGTGSGVFAVSLVQAAVPSLGIWDAKLTLTTNTSTSARIVIPVYLAVSPYMGAPFGSFDTPADNATGLNSSVPVTGWALDDVGVSKVELWREPVRNEAVHPNGLVYIGVATFVPDTRPDVAAMFPDKPYNYRSGWGYMMLTNFLNSSTGGPAGNGTYKLHAIAVDEEGHTTDLGVKTITVNNLIASKPFGTIDTPASGEVISGSAYTVFGWALTPQPYKVLESGKDIWLVVDGLFLGNLSYNNPRGDIATLFPTYANADGAAGYYTLDTTKLTNGIHTMSWVVTDSAGRTDGVGSRYFFVRNTTSVAAGTPRPILAMGEQAAADALAAGVADVEELGRVELQLPPGMPWSGHLLHNEDRVPLPAGSTLDSDTGVFVWQLGAGYLGTFTLEFRNANETRIVRVIVRPQGSPRNFAEK